MIKLDDMKFSFPFDVRTYNMLTLELIGDVEFHVYFSVTKLLKKN